jgi:hypothetical protein
MLTVVSAAHGDTAVTPSVDGVIETVPSGAVQLSTSWAGRRTPWLPRVWKMPATCRAVVETPWPNMVLMLVCWSHALGWRTPWVGSPRNPTAVGSSSPNLTM